MTEHLDVLVVGAGLSGIAAGYHLQTACPDRSYAILEGRDCIGGTWDLFRYPGIRSDSDMYTLGYTFQPWPGDRALADGPSILAYVRDTARIHGIDQRIRFKHKVVHAAWSSTDARWTVTCDRGGERVELTCSFLLMCAGYYRYDRGHAPSFAGADLDTGLIERERARLFGRPGLSLRIAAAGVVAHTLALEAAQVGADPWSARDGWRLAGDALRRFDLAEGETHHEVLLRRRHAGGMALSVGGETFTLAVDSQGPERHTLWLGEGLQAERVLVHTYARGEDVTVFCAQGSATLTEVDVIARAGDRTPSGGRLTAPMPGKLVALHVKAGDAVKAGQLLAVMEAMKMEHAIQCPRDGVVAECLYAVGDQLGDGAELLRLQS